MKERERKGQVEVVQQRLKHKRSCTKKTELDRTTVQNHWHELYKQLHSIWGDYRGHKKYSQVIKDKFSQLLFAANKCEARDANAKDNIMMGIAVIEARQRLDHIAEIIERVDNRCMAVDGDATRTQDEITGDELKEMYTTAKLHRSSGKGMSVQVFVQQGLITQTNSGPYYVIIKKGVQSFRLDYNGTKEECEWYAHMLRLVLSSGDVGTATEAARAIADRTLLDAGVLIRRLIARIIKDNPSLQRPAIIAQAQGWLRRKGLQGSILREKK